jgi:hypothetical protein
MKEAVRVSLPENHMGLDAVVYKNWKNLDLELNAESFHVDETTGEVYWDDAFEGQRPPSSTFTALHKRLGNIATVSHLREEVAHVLGNTTGILQTRFLYNGEHCGDVVGLEMLDKLVQEITFLKGKTDGSRSPYLATFLDNVTELIQAARLEQNPIVFT